MPENLRASTDDLSTLVVHAGQNPAGNGLSPNLDRSSVFPLPGVAQGAAIHEGRQAGYFYGRMGSPTQARLEAAMTELEGGEAALATASGMAAVSATLLAVLKRGDHLIAPRSLYATTGAFFDGMLADFGVAVSYVDAVDAHAVQSAMRRETRVVYIETPANPTLNLTDIKEVTAIARERNALSVVDNTLATPVNQQPIRLGADVVIHSASKYLGGHADLIGGVAIGPRALIDDVRWRVHKVLGPVMAPDTAWLVLRGLRTLALRMARHNENAQLVAEFLSGHPKVANVHYPGLADHPQHELAGRQMAGFGGLVAFELANFDQARRMLEAVRLCTLAVSLGDVASLIQHSASMTHAVMPAARRAEAGISDGLIRLSVGIERAADICADLAAALDAV